MALALTEEQSMLGDSVRAFLTEQAPVTHLRALRDSRSPEGYSPALWQRFAELGFTGTLIPEAHGGLGLGAVEAGVIGEALGHTLTPSPFLSSAVIAAALLADGASAEQQAKWLPAIARGSLIAALALDEKPKHQPQSIALAAQQSGSGFRLDGHKTFVVDGHVAGLLIVVARTAGASNDDDGISLFAVEPASHGVTIERTAMVDAHNAARIAFAAVEVGADALIGPLHGGRPLLDRVLDLARAVVASELVGIADEVLARTTRYLGERKQFSRTIGEFQALQHRAAHLYCEIEVARAITLKAQQALAGGAGDARLLVTAAKAKAGSAATRAVQEGVQMHGGIGVTDEFEMGFFMKRARVLQELLGDANFHGDRLATLQQY
ncbi:MAG TPA: acyl-CoA dehydrogenase family protein [Burkholderiaceae bacterium]|nr:acyl-CoA dehydrogenase family protein [Burkholderiaceae bacterium]